MHRITHEVFLPNMFNFNLIKPLVLYNFQIQEKQKKEEQDKPYCKESIRQIQTVDTQEKWSDHFNKSVYLGEGGKEQLF